MMAPQLNAQVYAVPPVFTGEPVTGTEDGLGLQLAGATPEEYSAALVWGLRSGLNVAALQCSHSAFYDTTDNYNAMLADQRPDLAQAYTVLTNYFARTNGATIDAAAPATKGKAKTKKAAPPNRVAMNALNQYDTRSYNGWSTLYAQRGFCHEASMIGKELRFVPPGGMLAFAQANMRSFRNSLVFAGDPLLATRALYYPLPDLRLQDNCYDKRGNLKDKCLR